MICNPLPIISQQTPAFIHLAIPCGRWGREHKAEVSWIGEKILRPYRVKAQDLPWQERQWVQAGWAVLGFAVMGKHVISDRPNYGGIVE